MTPRQDPERFHVAPTHSNSGRMTRAMRAARELATPSVLRIGVVQEGKIIDERLMKQRAHVTVGPTERSTFVVPSGVLPASHRLFELVGDAYRLNIRDGMAGRVSLDGEISDLRALRNRAEPDGQGNYQVSLTEASCGRIVFGDTTFLFQFVVPPQAPSKPRLPLSLQHGVSDQIDWAMTLIAAFSFLVHFGLVGTLYSDWMDPVVSDEMAVASFIDRVRSLPGPVPVETPKEPAEPIAPEESRKESQPPGGGPSASRPGNSGGGGAHPLRSAELERVGLDIISQLNGTARPTAGASGRSEAPLTSLDEAARRAAGVNTGASTGLHLGEGSTGPLRVGGGGHGLDSLGKTTAGTEGPGAPPVVRGPELKTEVGHTDVKSGSLVDADRVVLSLRPGFRHCYNQGLAKDPSLQGSVRIVATVGPNGEVLSATSTGSSTLGDEVVACVIHRVKGATFAPPAGDRATVVIPVTFALQRP
jgi:hypothetical protein